MPAIAPRRARHRQNLIGALAVATATALMAAGPAQAASPAWELLAATAPTNLAPKSSEIQTVAVNATGGTYTLTFAGQTTIPLAFDASIDDVGAALEALSSIGGAGGSVQVAGGPGDAGANRPYSIRFGGSLTGTNVAQMTATSSLTGGAGTATVATQTAGGTDGTTTLVIYPINIGSLPTTGLSTVHVDLPAGVTTAATATGGRANASAWSCTPAGAGQSSFDCTATQTIEPGAGDVPLLAPVKAPAASAGTLMASVQVSGGGTSAPGSFQAPIVISEVPAPVGVQAFFAGAYDENGLAETRAGAHPALATTGFLFNTIVSPTGKPVPAGTAHDVVADLPAGFVANPMLTVRCRRSDPSCDNDAAVGTTAGLAQGIGDEATGVGLYNVLPADGSAAQLTFQYIFALISTEAHLRPTDFGVRGLAPNLPSDYKPFGAIVSLWGEPGDPVHDRRRCAAPGGAGCALPNPGSVQGAFLTNPTDCPGHPLETLLSADFWQDIGNFTDPLSASAPAITDCADVPFEPITTSAATTTKADAASGLDFDVSIPQDGLSDPDELAQSHLRDVAVDLPAGLAVNPSGATGLAACSDAQMAPGTDDVPACPDGSRIGSVSITSPLVDRAIAGTMYLGTPKSTDPASGDMLRLWVVARDDDLGILIKLPGSSTADPSTGKLVATFKNNPRLPFDHLTVKLKGGSRGLLATPQTCATRSISSTLAPWSGTVAVTQSSALKTDAGCGFGFAPKVKAGNSNGKARGTGAFSFTFSREDGEQWVNGLTVALPTGLLASVKDVPLCTSGQADAGACPAASKIGTVDGAAGSGTPFVLEQKGSAFLTEGYKGCAYGLDVTVPVVAGPFDGKTPATDLGSVNVRQSVCVDPVTAQVTVTSDPLPTIWHGIPLRVRSITVSVDRQDFMVNPSSCEAKTVGAAFLSPQGGKALASSPFAVTGCKELPYAPKIDLALTDKGETKDGGHPGVVALVTQQPGEAGIKKAQVTLPLQLALDPDNANGLCEYADSLKYDCPESSIIGTATAWSPLLNKPLTGPVYFSKNVRFNAKGDPIRTLPTLAVKLRGEIAVNLRANTNVDKKNRLVNTFGLTDAIPDAPISQFLLNIDGGDHGVLAVTHDQDLCERTGRAVAETDGHNGAQHDFFINLATPCERLASLKSVQAKKRLVYARAYVPGAGRITARDINGHFKTAVRDVTQAGTYLLVLKPSAKGRRALAAGKTLHAAIGLRFKPAGDTKAAPFGLQDVTVKPAKRKRRR
ncbi:MAG: hypothetical protein ACJ762_06185 [Solirubrobacteraceae bacterium]